MIQTQSHIAPVFKELSEGFRRAIISHFHLKIFVPDECIIHVILRLACRTLRSDGTFVQAGDTGAEMYIIRDGECVVLSPNERTTLALLRSGSFFGDIDLILRSRRTATVKTRTYCTMFVLKRSISSCFTHKDIHKKQTVTSYREDLENILEEFPGHKTTLIESTKRRRDMQQQKNASFTEFLKCLYLPLKFWLDWLQMPETASIHKQRRIRIAYLCISAPSILIFSPSLSTLWPTASRRTQSSGIVQETERHEPMLDNADRLNELSAKTMEQPPNVAPFHHLEPLAHTLSHPVFSPAQDFCSSDSFDSAD